MLGSSSPFNPLHSTTDVLNRPVLDANLDGGGAEKASLEGLGQYVGQRRFELRHFLRVAG